MSLNIVVAVKWVPNTQVVNIDPKTGTLIREGIPSIINPHDLNAVELALQLKERYGGTVTAISMAPTSARAGLEFIIGMGVDRAILVTDRVFAGADTLATSYTLSKAIERLKPFDILVFGQETIDSSTAHIGAQTASWLRIPYIYYVTDVEYLNGVVKVKRKLEKRIEVYELPIPCLLVVAMKSNEPRSVKLSYKLKAKMENCIEVWTNNELGLTRECVGLRGSPTRVEKSIATPSVPRKKQKFDGQDVKTAVKWLVDKLVEEGLKIV
ncbi:MAG: electron transfer flavoprotein subunit beta/FixA family protein [Nitrososphaerota archaeon]